MQTLSSFKQGDTFSLACSYQVSGTPTSLTGITIAAQIRNLVNGALIETLTVTVANQSTSAGSFVISAPNADTSTWPLGSLICDIQFTNGSTVTSSDSFIIPVIAGVTA